MSTEHFLCSDINTIIVSTLKVDTINPKTSWVTDEIAGNTVSPPGALLQVVSSTLTSAYTFSTGVGQTYTAIPNLSATITPSSTSSKILLFTSLNFGQDGAHAVVIWVRGSTDIAVGDAASSRTVGSFALHSFASSAMQEVGTHHFLDTPATTSEITYALHARSNEEESIYINRSHTDTDSHWYQRTVSTITAMEIAG